MQVAQRSGIADTSQEVANEQTRSSSIEARFRAGGTNPALADKVRIQLDAASNLKSRSMFLHTVVPGYYEL